MKAIQTEYKGYKFRSRLEARWAVFFDALGIEWEYEKEGYDLGEAGWYLPDFFIEAWDCFIEIKGTQPTKGELEKAIELSKHKAVVIFTGIPPGNGIVYLTDTCDSGGGDMWNDVYISLKTFPEIEWCLTIDNFYRSDRSFYLPDGEYSNHIQMEYIPNTHYSLCEKVSFGMQAIHAARSARFEHGESPQF